MARKHDPIFPHRLPDHDGETYESERDKPRLNAQMRRVFEAMSDRRWHTLGDLAHSTGDPEASISARLRDLRKPKFGGFVIDRKYVGNGLFTYKMGEPDNGA